MKKCETIWMVLVILFPLTQAKHLECKLDDLCNCYHDSKYEYQCPPDVYKIVLKTVPGAYLEVDCANLIDYDLNIFPDIDVGNVEYFQMRFCPLPNDSFRSTIEKFNISKVNHFLLEDIYNTQVKAVTSELFDGLSFLEKLTFRYFNITFEEDFLKNLPNLINLDLDNNEIEEVGGTMFYYTPKLRVLHLSRNNIHNLPNGVFKNLTDLQQLHLWNNKLTRLNKNMFTGLGNQLKSLELSINKIMSVDEDTFSELTQLVTINLRTNNLNILGPTVFKYNTALEGVRLGNNPNLSLSDYIFSNLTSLNNLNIDNSNLEELPENIFAGSVNIIEISLKNNNIKILPANVFKDLTKLQKLDLSANKITTLPNEIFYFLKDLTDLDLNRNLLTEINDKLFENIHKIRTLNLTRNMIHTIHLNAFFQLIELTMFDLSYNQYELNYGLEGLNPFNNCQKLVTLNLSHNLIEALPEGIIENKIKLKFFNLNYNKITELRVASLIKVSLGSLEVSLNSNNISVVDFSEIINAGLNPQEYDATHNDSSTIVTLSDNPIQCDCSNFDFVQYLNDQLNPVIKLLIKININDVHCASPEDLKHNLIRQLKPYDISCPLTGPGCPEECVCSRRPFDECAVMDCSHKNFTKPPLIFLSRKDTTQIEMHLEGNELDIAPSKELGYENVTKLYLSNNRIRNISWIPPRIEVLKLNGNRLKFLNSRILDNLNTSTTLQNLTLSENPWSCSCSALELQDYLRSHFRKVKTSDVICADNKQPLINTAELCKSHMTIVMYIAIPILVILSLGAMVAVVFLWYKQEIKVWLYAKNLCLWFVTEEELDKDKVYDVFISYSHKDEGFVMDNLLPILESGPNPLKVCIHVRDWVPGEFIATQVTNSVLDSRRTLVVLSDNFLESVWGKMEFRTAHTQAISEGRARVIIVKYGSLNEEKLDNELKTYLKTNTYVEWGDTWFWNKLKYALPHSKQNKFYNNNQKHANIMLKIDDKFELVTSSPTVHAESTPPVISLDPSLLKNHPLNFKRSDNTVTPPAEGPLLINR